MPTTETDSDVRSYVNEHANVIRRAVDDIISSQNVVKLNIRINVRFMRETADGDDEQTEGGFSSSPLIISSSADINLQGLIDDLDQHLENFNKNGSQWVVECLLSFNIRAVSFRPLEGSSYIATPPNIVAKGLF